MQCTRSTAAQHACRCGPIGFDAFPAHRDRLAGIPRPDQQISATRKRQAPAGLDDPVVEFALARDPGPPLAHGQPAIMRHRHVRRTRQFDRLVMRTQPHGTV